MERLVFRGLVIEGHVQWTRDGEFLGDYSGGWDLKKHRGVLMRVQSKGVMVLDSRNHLDTLDAVTHMAEWSEKEENQVSSLLQRGGPRSEWGTHTDRDTAVWILTSIGGIGRELAARIFDHFGRVPISWDADRTELAKVPGLGPKRLDALFKSLPGRDTVQDSSKSPQ